MRWVITAVFVATASAVLLAVSLINSQEMTRDEITAALAKRDAAIFQLADEIKSLKQKGR